MNPAPVAAYPTAPSPQGAYVEHGRMNDVEIIRIQEPARGPGIGAVIGFWRQRFNGALTRRRLAAPV